MHIEKNVCDNVIGTLLEIPGKNKDHLNARYDLKELGVMQELTPKLIDRGRRAEITKSCFWMTLDQKCRFCNAIKNAKLPKVCDSIIARCVQDRKITGYKSHDGHFLMQYLLPLAAKETLHKDVALLLIRLSAYFKGICSKTIDPADVDYLEQVEKKLMEQVEEQVDIKVKARLEEKVLHLLSKIREANPRVDLIVPLSPTSEGDGLSSHGNLGG